MALITRGIDSHQSRSLAKKDAFQKHGFFSLKMSVEAKKKWTQHFVKIFQVSADEGMAK